MVVDGDVDVDAVSVTVSLNGLSPSIKIKSTPHFFAQIWRIAAVIYEFVVLVLLLLMDFDKKIIVGPAPTWCREERTHRCARQAARTTAGPSVQQRNAIVSPLLFVLFVVLVLAYLRSSTINCRTLLNCVFVHDCDGDFFLQAEEREALIEARRRKDAAVRERLESRTKDWSARREKEAKMQVRKYPAFDSSSEDCVYLLLFLLLLLFLVLLLLLLLSNNVGDIVDVRILL